MQWGVPKGGHKGPHCDPPPRQGGAGQPLGGHGAGSALGTWVLSACLQAPLCPHVPWGPPCCPPVCPRAACSPSRLIRTAAKLLLWWAFRDCWGFLGWAAERIFKDPLSLFLEKPHPAYTGRLTSVPQRRFNYRPAKPLQYNTTNSQLLRRRI